MKLTHPEYGKNMVEKGVQLEEPSSEFLDFSTI